MKFYTAPCVQSSSYLSIAQILTINTECCSLASLSKQGIDPFLNNEMNSIDKT